MAAALCLPDGYNLALATKAQGAVLMTALVVLVAGESIEEAGRVKIGRRSPSVVALGADHSW